MQPRRIYMLPLKMFFERNSPREICANVFKVGSYTQARTAQRLFINDAFARNIAEIKERKNFQAFVLRDGYLIFETARKALFAAKKTFLIAANAV